MRESIGGLFLLKIMVIFIILYNGLLAVAVNYAMAFRVKNEVINILEQNEGCTPAISDIQGYLAKVGYNKKKNLTIEPNIIENRGVYYKVTTYLTFDIPVVGNFFEFPIEGETTLIYKKDTKANDISCSGKYLPQ